MTMAAVVAVLTLAIPADSPRSDIVIADFEGDDYGTWTATGSAFGTTPARGTLPGQMTVEGFLGRGLVNSFSGGDDATGRLVSTPFTIERSFLNFLIGGGGFPGETCVNLRVDGEVARTATGPNREPGGSERLRWRSWDVRELRGRQAVIEVVDERLGGWGHINVDHIVQSDEAREAKPASREIRVEHRFLHIPVRTGAPKRRMRFDVDGQTVREFEIELAEEEASFRVFADLEPFRGRRLTIHVDELDRGPESLSRIRSSDELPDAEALYREAHRPQFHFTSRRGWLNDPNGLVWHEGEYHLFYQHNPYGWDWGNMHWGHAISTDLVHWREQPIALYPKRYGDWAFSGSGLIDVRDTGGFRSGRELPLVVAYTSTGRGECLAYSLDRGRSFREYEGNPVLGHQGRDPKVIWHAPSRRWVMAVYDEEGDRKSIAFHTSADLKSWTSRSRIDGFFECPDLFELPIEGSNGSTRWVLHGADGRYLLGSFDGERFVADHDEKLTVWYGNFYAAQSFSDMPDGRRVQIGWGRGVTFPGMPFNQQMTVPCRLTLRPTEEGPRLFAWPVEELDRLHGKHESWSNMVIKPGMKAPSFSGDLLDVRCEFELPADPTARVGLMLRGVPIVYEAAKREISCRDIRAPLSPIEGRVRLRLLLDRGSIEIFGNDGKVAISVGVIPPDQEHVSTVWCESGEVRIRSLDVFEMRSIWPSPDSQGLGGE